MTAPRIYLDRPYFCPVCRQKVRQLYPLTRYDERRRHWIAVNACLKCCGPTGDEDTSGIGSQFRPRVIERR